MDARTTLSNFAFNKYIEMDSIDNLMPFPSLQNGSHRG